MPAPASTHQPWHPSLSSDRLHTALLLLALFLLVTGARLWLVQNYSTSLPYADQWDGEAAAVLKPWAEGNLPPRNFLLPHNEHRIVLTRALLLGLFAGNGQWDPQLEMAVNAALCGAFAALMSGALIRVFGARWRWLAVAAVAVYATPPFGWENTLGGFQSQNYFLVIFSLAAVWGLALYKTGSFPWWLGLAGVALACLSMGSGFLAAAAVLALLAARMVRERRLPAWREGLTAVVCVGVVAAGWLTRVEVPAHAVLRATSPGAFVSAFCRFAAWPWYGGEWWVLPMVAPLLLLAARYFRTPHPDGQKRRVELLLAVGVWAILQTAALAYSRDGHGAPPACRYMDLLAVLPLTNALALALLLTATRPGTVARPLAAGAALLWLGLLGGGLWNETRRDFQNWLPDHLAAQLRGEANVRGYLATHDFRHYLADPPPDDVPFPVPERLAGLLDDPTIHAFLPADVRAPLPVRLTAGSAFVPDGFPPAMQAVPWVGGWGSYGRGVGTSEAVIPGPSGASPALPFLQFRFAGDLGEPHLSFVLGDAAGGHSVDWRPARVPRERWRIDYLRRPGAGDLRLKASAADAGKWFAFTAPVEVGAWSYWAGFGLRRGGVICEVGVGLALATMLVTPLLMAHTRFRQQKRVPLTPQPNDIQ